ncbi:Pvc16 family protein [Streptomyces sp. YIM S03343]
MIHEVDRVLKDLLRGGALTGSGIDVSFEAPTRDWSARRNGPVINAYLYDIREDVNRRQRGHVEVRDQRDVVVKRRQPPRWFRLSYLVIAWTKQPEDEHRLISAVLATLIPREMLAPEELPGSLRALGLSVPISVAGIQTESRSLAEIWSALGGELRPSLDVVVTAPFHPDHPTPRTGPPPRHHDGDGGLGCGGRVCRRGTAGTVRRRHGSRGAGPQGDPGARHHPRCGGRERTRGHSGRHPARQRRRRPRRPRSPTRPRSTA